MKPGPTILVVDDHDAHRHLIRLALGKQGYRVEAACDGQEALAYLAEHTPDAMLFDVHMPGMSGLELARQARELRRELRHVPLFFMTAMASERVRQEADAVGATSLLHKPVAQEDLHRALEQALG